jgi:hypothetical protein
VAHRGRRNADEALALAVASGQTLRAAAEVADVSERTAARRWSDLGFRRRVDALRSEMAGRALGRLADGLTEAADTLRGLLKADADTVKLGAARALLELGTKLRESVELAGRVEEIERLLSEDGDEPGKPYTPPAAQGEGTSP